ncbi:uncharacterized protein [Diabrotica undecimpunctata]|uniref:uncharacterized protein n=1 Tax=Diabrotica undecimpunctata TaxID=50387 RepID=UPI003B63278C
MDRKGDEKNTGTNPVEELTHEGTAESIVSATSPQSVDAATSTNQSQDFELNLPSGISLTGPTRPRLLDLTGRSTSGTTDFVDAKTSPTQVGQRDSTFTSDTACRAQCARTFTCDLYEAAAENTCRARCNTKSPCTAPCSKSPRESIKFSETESQTTGEVVTGTESSEDSSFGLIYDWHSTASLETRTAVSAVADSGHGEMVFMNDEDPFRSSIGTQTLGVIATCSRSPVVGELSPLSLDFVNPNDPFTSEQVITAENPNDPLTSEQVITAENPNDPLTSEQVITAENPNDPFTSEQVITAENPNDPLTSEQVITEEKAGIDEKDKAESPEK